MAKDILHSTCRRCRQPVIYAFLPRMPGEEGKSFSQAIYRPRMMIWYHKGRTLGEELHCDEKAIPKVRAAPRDYCVEHISSRDAWSVGGMCNRKVKDHDLFMCGIHARQSREDERKRKEYTEKRDLSNYVFDEVLRIQAEIAERFGLKTQAEYDWRQHEYTGKVVVNPRELLDLLIEASVEEEEWEHFG